MPLDINTITLPESCITCGACCSYTDPKWIEVSGEDRKRLNNDDLIESGDVESYAMKQTKQGKCVALQGKIGVKVSCSVYPNRPQVCCDVMPGSNKCIYMLGLRQLGKPW